MLYIQPAFGSIGKPIASYAMARRVGSRAIFALCRIEPKRLVYNLWSRNGVKTVLMLKRDEKFEAHATKGRSSPLYDPGIDLINYRLTQHEPQIEGGDVQPLALTTMLGQMQSRIANPPTRGADRVWTIVTIVALAATLLSLGGLFLAISEIS